MTEGGGRRGEGGGEGGRGGEGERGGESVILTMAVSLFSQSRNLTRQSSQNCTQDVPCLEKLINVQKRGKCQESSVCLFALTGQNGGELPVADWTIWVVPPGRATLGARRHWVRVNIG